MHMLLFAVAVATHAPPESPAHEQVTIVETAPVPDRDIVVTAPLSEVRVQAPTVQIGAGELLIRQPASIAQALQGLAGVSVKTNSRGDTIARVRGAEERQTAVFLDGAPLNVPWDGRVDLGVLPAGLIGNVRAIKGAAPFEFGANATSGVIDLQTRRDPGVAAVAQAGTYGLVNASVAASFGGPAAGLTLAGGYLARDAVRVADPAALPFSQDPASRRRTNTDLDSYSLFAAAGGALGPVEARLSVLHARADRGVAPESDRNPTVVAPRYWRYPDIELTQATLNARTALGGGASVHGVLYRQWFAQRILAYRTVGYTTLRSTEDDTDATLGGRVTLAVPGGPVDLRLLGSHQRSTHRQVDTPAPGVAGPRLAYRQTLSSVGAEGDLRFGPASRLTLGLGYDRAAAPLTGDKPAQPDQGALAFSAAFRQRLGDPLTLTVSAGRRTRFASLRELFGEALGRFLLNPDLRARRAGRG